MTVTSDRPDTGPFPKLTEPQGEHPYRRPTFTPRQSGEDRERVVTVHERVLSAMQEGGWPSRADVGPRYPSVGHMLEAQHAAARDLPPLDVRAPGEALRHLMYGKPGEAAAEAAPAPEAAPGAGLEPGPAPEPADAPAAEPSPGWLRTFLLSAIDDAAYGVSEALDQPCPLDRHTASGWCEHCTDLYERAGRYARLQELLLAVPASDSASAVRILLAEGWR